MKRFLFLLALCVLTVLVRAEDGDEPDIGALPASEADGVGNAVIPDPRPTLFGLLAESPNHRILFTIVDTFEEIKEPLDNPGARFTVLAPVDNAFIRLTRELSPGVTFNESDPQEVVGTLVSAIDNIREVPNFPGVVGLVWYHVLQGAFTYGMLENFGSLKTIQGQNLTFVDGTIVDGDDSRTNTSASPRNIFTLNGWANPVFGVLLPFNLQAAVEIVEAIPTPTPAAVTPEPTPPVDPTVTPTPAAVDDDDTSAVPVPVGVDDDGVPTGTDEDSTETSPESTDDDDDDEVCFPASATVTTIEGESVRMADLQPGQHVHHDEHGASSPVFFFTHRTAKPELWFYSISTASGHAVSMTAKHYLYADGRLTAAHAVQVGQMLRTKAGESAVTSVKRVRDTGLFAPHSMHGDLLVDGIVVSSYSRTIEPRLAHALLMPLRWLARATGSKEVLAGVFYEGGRGLERFLPKGQAQY
eukprot:TRINITY_DN329_c0_g1_i1.p2 TRINITY_DN329_c0_g1~~TRINITY_DN329_c0_g1_i1.p2  ORF type:complete len:471 (+),score=77.61 TRINITY_DN329_c0_g1_i1:4521-5933(+)